MWMVNPEIEHQILKLEIRCRILESLSSDMPSFEPENIKALRRRDDVINFAIDDLIRAAQDVIQYFGKYEVTK